MPITEFQLTVDRRELAAIQAGLRLLLWMSGADVRLMPYALAQQIDQITADGGAIEPLSDAEVRELAGRLTV